MDLITLVCIYLGYVGDGYAVLMPTPQDEYLLVTLRSAYSEQDPADLFDNLPYGTVCDLYIDQQLMPYSAAGTPGGGGASQYAYTYVGGTARDEVYSELSFYGEAFSVYSRDVGRKIQLRLGSINGIKVVDGADQTSAPDWYFLELDNYTELGDDAYAGLYGAWKKHYDSGSKLNVTIHLQARTEEFQNVWAPSDSTTVKHYWVISAVEY